MQPTPDKLRFLESVPGALALYAPLEDWLLANRPDAVIQVQKTQISFYDRHLFACVSFMRLRPRAALPQPYLVVSFGLDHPLDDPRVTAVQPYPGRWTHHVLLGAAQQVDGQLLDWLRQAADFAVQK